MHEIGVSADLLKQILKGRKTVEGRLRTGKFLVMRKGDAVSLREDVWENDQIVRSTPNKAVILIEESIFFDSFDEMLNVIDYKELIPTARSKAAALKTYHQFYTDEQIQEHSVVALRFSVLPPASAAAARKS